MDPFITGTIIALGLFGLIGFLGNSIIKAISNRKNGGKELERLRDRMELLESRISRQDMALKDVIQSNEILTQLLEDKKSRS